MRYFITKRHIHGEVLNTYKELNAISEEEARKEFDAVLDPLIMNFNLTGFRSGQQMQIENCKRDYYIMRIIMGDQEYCLTSDYLLSQLPYGV